MTVMETIVPRITTTVAIDYTKSQTTQNDGISYLQTNIEVIVLSGPDCLQDKKGISTDGHQHTQNHSVFGKPKKDTDPKTNNDEKELRKTAKLGPSTKQNNFKLQDEKHIERSKNSIHPADDKRSKFHYVSMYRKKFEKWRWWLGRHIWLDAFGRKSHFNAVLTIFAWCIVGIKAVGLDIQVTPKPAVLGNTVKFTCTFPGTINWEPVGLSWLVKKNKDTEFIYLFINLEPSVAALERNYTGNIENTDEGLKHYVLSIPKFTKTDATYEYRCDVGFSSETLRVPLSEDNYIYDPEESEIDVNICDANLKIVIDKIFPKPNCTVDIQDGMHTSKWRLKMNTTKIQIDQPFYYAELNADVSAVMLCKPKILITCGNLNTTWLIMNKTLNYCKVSELEKAVTKSFLEEILLPLFICVGIVFIGICLLCIYFRSKINKFCNKYSRLPQVLLEGIGNN